MKALPKNNPKLISQMLASAVSFGLFAYFAFYLLHGDMGYFALRGVVLGFAGPDERQILQK